MKDEFTNIGGRPRHRCRVWPQPSTGPPSRPTLRLGLIDQVVMNVVPVVLGAGRRFFGAMEPSDTVTRESSRVAQATG